MRFTENVKEYLDKIKKRSRRSRIYSNYQSVGLELANILSDLKHRSLYIKLAKQFGGVVLLSMAKRIAESRKISNLGAYFMKVLKSEGFFDQSRYPVLSKKKKQPKIKKLRQTKLF